MFALTATFVGRRRWMRKEINKHDGKSDSARSKVNLTKPILNISGWRKRKAFSRIVSEVDFPSFRLPGYPASHKCCWEQTCLRRAPIHVFPFFFSPSFIGCRGFHANWDSQPLVKWERRHLPPLRMRAFRKCPQKRRLLSAFRNDLLSVSVPVIFGE